MPLDPRRIEVIDDRTASVLRRMSVAEKLEMANRMYLDAREMMTHMIRRDHPEWDDRRVLAEVRRRVSRGAA